MITKWTKSVWIVSLLGFACLPMGMAGTVHADPGKGAAIAQQGDATAGVPPCSTCHGQSGEGMASIAPRLAGLSKTYILNQLTAFRTDTRKNAIMQPAASSITTAQANDLADYFSNATAASQPAPAPANIVAKGKELAERGVWADGLPACENCHAPNGIGVAPDFPYLGGQQADYIVQQLKDWRAGQRGVDPLGLMKAVAGKLDDDSFAAVGVYYASLPAPKRQGEN